MKPRLLDLFCGAGGAAMGYYRAGFEVVGVDIKPQPHYPFKVIQADALSYPLKGFDAYHASPPCQGYARSTNIRGCQKEHRRLIGRVRSMLRKTGKPYVIENVADAKKALKSPLMLCGTMFGLRVKRHRLFECSFDCAFAPASCGCHGKAGRTFAFRESSRFSKSHLITVTGHNFAVAEARIAMGIDWMTSREITQAIPPAYTEFIGRELLKYVQHG
jgi:DNA (cytosine-5)-methyltransferase 1